MLKLTSHIILVAMESILAEKYECLTKQNVCIYKLGWHIINNTIATCSVELSVMGKSTGIAHGRSAF